MSLNAIGLISKDINQSISFYKILGVDFKKDGEFDHYEAELKSGLRLMLDSVDLIKKINPKYEEKVGNKIVLCFEFFSVSELNDLYDEIINNGYNSVKEPWDAFWGQRYASILDPDGNQIDLFVNLTELKV